jgi:hypothetical protein
MVKLAETAAWAELIKEEITPEEKLYNLIDKVVVVEGKNPDSRIYWLFHIKCKVLKINVNKLLTVSAFRKQYIRAFNHPAPYIKAGQWDSIINSLYDNGKIESQRGGL